MVVHIRQTIGRGKQSTVFQQIIPPSKTCGYTCYAETSAASSAHRRPATDSPNIFEFGGALGASQHGCTLSQADAALAKRSLSLPSFTSGSVFHLSKVSSKPEAAQHAVLCAAGFSLRWLLRANVRGRIKPNSSACFLWRLSAIRAISAMPTSPGAHNCSEPTHRMPALPRTRAQFAVI